MRALVPTILATVVLVACGSHSTIPEVRQYGANPELPRPNEELIPTIDIAPAVHWADGATPRPANGLAVQAFATGLDHPRWTPRILALGKVFAVLVGGGFILITLYVHLFAGQVGQ